MRSCRRANARSKQPFSTSVAGGGLAPSPAEVLAGHSKSPSIQNSKRSTGRLR